MRRRSTVGGALEMFSLPLPLSKLIENDVIQQTTYDFLQDPLPASFRLYTSYIEVLSPAHTYWEYFCL